MTDRVELPLSGAAFGADPSFVELLRRQQPDALPSSLQLGSAVEVTQGTTVLGLRFADGIVMAGDRRATAGYTIAGAAGQAVETVRLFQLELEHYEKLTGDRLSLEGKANRLAQMIRANFPLAVQGLVVVPLFGGYDVARSEGRLFYYDATGGRWEEEDYQATGSGAQPAKNSLKKRWRPGLTHEEALRVAAEALIDAAEDDVATGGPDLARGIFPVVVSVTALGATESTDEDVASAVRAVVEARA